MTSIVFHEQTAVVCVQCMFSALVSLLTGSRRLRPLFWHFPLLSSSRLNCFFGGGVSVMAVASRSGVDVVANEVSGRQTPSAVYFAGNHRLIGEHTTGHAGGDPTNLVHHLKSMLCGEGGQGGEQRDQADGDKVFDSIGSSGGGSSSSSTAAAAAAAEPTFFCETRGGEEGFSSGQSAGLRAVVRHMGQPLELGASEVVSYLLRHCAGIVAREAAGREGAAPPKSSPSSPSSLSCVVASVPSYFSLRQKRAVLDAASIAGVAMPMVVNEGTAVALAYGILKGGLPPAGSSARPPLKVAFVDIGHSCTQVFTYVDGRQGGVLAARPSLGLSCRIRCALR